MTRPYRPSNALLGATLAALSVCAACDSPPSDAIEECAATQVIPSVVETDILFVVDDSGSMAEEQQNLADNLGAFVDTLAGSAVAIDYRIAVTTTSVEAFDGTTTYGGGSPEVGNPYPAGAIVADEPSSATAGDLVYDAAAYGATRGWGGLRVLESGASPEDVTAFKANFRVGTSGSGKEQPFRAARLALSDRIADGTNAGFLRHGARLAVIFVSDEDDCSDSEAPFTANTTSTGNANCHDETFKQTSLDPVSDFAAFLLGSVGGELRDVQVGAIVSPPEAACGTAYDEGTRFAELGTALGATLFQSGSICDASFHDSLQRFAEALAPSSLPLDGAPADWRLLAVRVTKADATVSCTIAPEASGEAAAADAVYVAPRLGRPASLTFQNACALELGDRVDVQVICAG